MTNQGKSAHLLDYYHGYSESGIISEDIFKKTLHNFSKVMKTPFESLLNSSPLLLFTHNLSWQISYTFTWTCSLPTPLIFLQKSLENTGVAVDREQQKESMEENRRPRSGEKRDVYCSMPGCQQTLLQWTFIYHGWSLLVWRIFMLSKSLSGHQAIVSHVIVCSMR